MKMVMVMILMVLAMAGWAQDIKVTTKPDDGKKVPWQEFMSGEDAVIRKIDGASIMYRRLGMYGSNPVKQDGEIKYVIGDTVHIMRKFVENKVAYIVEVSYPLSTGKKDESAILEKVRSVTDKTDVKELNKK